MKRILPNLGIAALVLLLGATGCKRTPKGITPIGSPRAAAVEGGASLQPANLPPGAGLEGAAVATEELEPGGGAQAPREFFEGYIMDPEAFKAQTVYFDFDSSVVKLSEIDKVRAVAEELKLRPEVRLLIDGHCDERGTEEYNRALGERRALAVREVLVKQGIAPDRIRTRSWGEDKPADPGHNEAAWAKNRRAEFILLLPPEQ